MQNIAMISANGKAVKKSPNMNLFQQVIHRLKPNWNDSLQKMGLVHHFTRTPIEEEFAITTSKGNCFVDRVEVQFFDGIIKRYSSKEWSDCGADILKNRAIKKLNLYKL